MENIRYPIGHFNYSNLPGAENISELLKSLTELPAAIAKRVINLNNEQLNTTYRENGWTIRQVVHHMADSHLNGYARIKTALTESEPAIQAYDEVKWSNLPDASGGPIETSLLMLASINDRLIYLYSKLDESDFNKYYIHPEAGNIKLSTALSLYHWHLRHHFAHINNLIEKESW